MVCINAHNRESLPKTFPGIGNKVKQFSFHNRVYIIVGMFNCKDQYFFSYPLKSLTYRSRPQLVVACDRDNHKCSELSDVMRILKQKMLYLLNINTAIVQFRPCKPHVWIYNNSYISKGDFYLMQLMGKHLC